jgi:hypothetical protein
MVRPNEREFLQEVLRDLADLPEGFARRFLELFDGKDPDRAEAIRRLFEDFGRE